MSITDELKEYAEGCYGGSRTRLKKIADRIDKAHESKLAEVAGDWDYWESTHIELPKDADGEPIHIGDVMEWVDDKNVARTVSGVGTDVFFAWSEDNYRYFQYEAKAFRHRCEPTIEDVLTEFAHAMYKNLGMYTGVAIDVDEWLKAYAKTITEYAEKLREVVEHDDATLGRETCSVCEGYDDEGEECGDVCSACGEPWVVYDAKFCPHCGARKVEA